MSVEARVKAALDVFGDPVEASLFSEKPCELPARYYTFVCNSFGDDFGDDMPGHERWLIQVHFFAPLGENWNPRKRATKLALFQSGFTWPQFTDATDQNGQHFVFECETAEAVEEMEAE